MPIRIVTAAAFLTALCACGPALPPTQEVVAQAMLTYFNTARRFRSC